MNLIKGGVPAGEKRILRRSSSDIGGMMSSVQHQMQSIAARRTNSVLGREGKASRAEVQQVKRVGASRSERKGEKIR